MWEAAPAGFGPGGNRMYSEYFQGLLYADALELDRNRPETRFRSDVFLRESAVGEVIGLSVSGQIPAPALSANEKDWVWFLLGPRASSPDDASAEEGQHRPLKLCATLYAVLSAVSR